MRGTRNVRKKIHFMKMIMKFCAKWNIVYGVTNSDAGGFRNRQTGYASEAHRQMSACGKLRLHTTCQVFAHICEYPLSRKITHLSNIGIKLSIEKLRINVYALVNLETTSCQQLLYCDVVSAGLCPTNVWPQNSEVHLLYSRDTPK